MGNHRADHIGPDRAGSTPQTPYAGRRVARALPERPEPTTPYVGRRVARPVEEPVPTLDTSDARELVTADVSSADVAPAANPFEVPDPRTPAEITADWNGWNLFAAESPAETGALPFALTEAFTGTLPRIEAEPGTDFSAETTVSLPAVRPTGKRRAAKRAARRSRFKALPSLPVLVGAASLAVAATGAATSGHTSLVRAESGPLHQASALTGATEVASVGRVRGSSVSRSRSRSAVDSVVKERAAGLAAWKQQAAGRSQVLKANQWQLPIAPGAYRLTATFGEYGLWSHAHTGLDFAADTGTTIRAMANGVVTETGYAGAYGNRTIITLEDGTELWFCHQTEIDVSTGQQVHAGEAIGTVGSTGHVTGPHLHLEVRPGGGDPVDPYPALVEQGLQP